MHGSFSPTEPEHSHRASTTVADRSFLTDLLVLVLAATFVCPCSLYGSAGKPSDSTIAGREGRPDNARGMRASNHACQPAPDRHASKLRGVLDDDPAIVRDDSEDWLEGPTGFAPQYMAPPCAGFLPVIDQIVMTLAGPSRNPTWPIHFLCSYQC